MDIQSDDILVLIVTALLIAQCHKTQRSQRAVHTKYVFSQCFDPGKLGGVLHKNLLHHLQISVCLADNDVFCRRIIEILDPFSLFPGFLAEF